MILRPTVMGESSDNPLKKTFFCEGGADNYLLDKRIVELGKRLKKYKTDRPDNLANVFAMSTAGTIKSEIICFLF